MGYENRLKNQKIDKINALLESINHHEGREKLIVEFRRNWLQQIKVMIVIIGKGSERGEFFLKQV